jgi:hypothetical protein
LPISRYVYSHHETPARRCDPLSGGNILRVFHSYNIRGESVRSTSVRSKR